MKSKNPHRRPESFIRQPNYPGGNKALDEFIRTNLRYPEEALENRVEGTVAVVADIDVKGKVVATKIKHGIGYGCDEEAVRVVSLLQFEKKKYRGLYVMFHRTLNIHFKLPGTAQLNVVYQYKETKTENKSYGYTIRI